MLTFDATIAAPPRINKHYQLERAIACRDIYKDPFGKDGPWSTYQPFKIPRQMPIICL